MPEIVRWSMFFATIFLAVLGYPDQIRLIIAQKSTAGLSFFMVLAAFWSWLSYTLYGFFSKDFKMFWPNLIGTVFITIILLSFLIY